MNALLRTRIVDPERSAQDRIDNFTAGLVDSSKRGENNYRLEQTAFLFYFSDFSFVYISIHFKRRSC